MKPPTKIKDLQAMVRSPAWRSVDRTEQAVRSIQQSMRVEGHDVPAETVRQAIANHGETQALDQSRGVR